MLAKSVFLLFLLARTSSLRTAKHRRMSGSSLLSSSVLLVASSSASVWDEQNKVWLGQADGVLDSALPDPLYVFGYGSLLFRPGEILESLESHDVVCRTHRRSFSQRSSDHRGRPHFPGLVVTLLENEGGESALASGGLDSCLGRVWRVPDDVKAALLTYLDFRERGGYTRQVVEVELLGGGAMVKALVYTGLPSNPNFFLAPSKLNAASIIAASSGVSGENADYLFQLQAYLHSQRYADASLLQLKDCVIDRMAYSKVVSKYKAGRVASVFDTYLGDSGAGVCALFGWGSGEYGQLGAVDCSSSSKADCVCAPVALRSIQDLVVATEGADEGTTDGLLAHPTAKVLAGGGASGLLLHHSNHAGGAPGRLYLFGSAAADGGCAAIAAAVAPGCALTASAIAAEDGTPVLCVRGVLDAAMGHDHTLIIAEDPTLLYQLQTGGGAPSAARRELPAGENARKVAVGASHAAAITSSGCLHVWQLPSFTGSKPLEINGWSPGEGAQLVDVCCGWKSVVAVDSRGRLWLAGRNKHLRVDSSDPVCVDTAALGLPADAVWVSVSCGWSHAVARGVRPDGSACFASLGRDDLSQLGGGGAGPLRPPPCAPAELVSVWCGPEHTLAADAEGRLWSCGWGEHGNLGGGDLSQGAWRRVGLGAMAGAREGQVSCGGAHCLVLARVRQE